MRLSIVHMTVIYVYYTILQLRITPTEYKNHFSNIHIHLYTYIKKKNYFSINLNQRN